MKEKITERAGELFMRYGIRSVTMDEIAREMAVSKKTLYQYFKDKDDVVRSATSFLIDCDKNEFFEIHEKSSNSIEELQMISQLIRQKIGDMNPSLLFDLQKYHPESWELYVAYKREMLGYIEENLRQGITEGYFRDNLDPRTIARMRMEMVQIAFDENVFPKTKFDFREVQIQFFDHFVEGIITEKGRKLFREYLNNDTHINTTT